MLIYFCFVRVELFVAQLSDLDFKTHSHELLVYLVGSIRFLTQNHYKVLERFVKLGTIGHVMQIMTSVNEAVCHQEIIFLWGGGGGLKCLPI